MFPLLLGVVVVVGLLTRFLGGMLFIPLGAALFLRVVWWKELRRTRRGRIIVTAILIIGCVLDAVLMLGTGNDSAGWHYPLAMAIGVGMAVALMPLVFVK